MWDARIRELEKLQTELDFRNEIENHAIKLIGECKFEDSIKWLQENMKSNEKK
ncbi:MAG: hypothetical protein ACERKN_07275 [Velocimicrobium sp.]